MRIALLLLLLVLTLGLIGPAAAQISDPLYIVQPGDRLADLAARVGAPADCIARANGIQVSASLRAGQALTIPRACLSYSVNPQAAPRPYTVQRGDRLNAIASRFNAPMQCLVLVNNLPSANIIRAGQRLNLGPCIAGAAPVTPTPPPVTQPPPATGFYTVQPGDQLRFIAARFNTTWRCLAQANGIRNPDRIFAGQVLNVASCAGQGGGVSPLPVTPIPPTAGVCFGDRNPGRFPVGGRYTIRAGDTLDFIACDLNITLSCLAAANPGVGNIGRIFPGQSIIVPNGCPPWDGPRGGDAPGAPDPVGAVG